MSGIFRSLVRHTWRSVCKSLCAGTQVWGRGFWRVSGGLPSSAVSLDHSAAFTAAGIEIRGGSRKQIQAWVHGGLSHGVPAPSRGAAPEAGWQLGRGGAISGESESLASVPTPSPSHPSLRFLPPSSCCPFKPNIASPHPLPCLPAHPLLSGPTSGPALDQSSSPLAWGLMGTRSYLSPTPGTLPALAGMMQEPGMVKGRDSGAGLPGMETLGDLHGSGSHFSRL